MRHLIASLATILVLAAASSVGHAGDTCPGDPIDDVRRTAFNLSYQVDRRGVLLDEQYHALRHSLYSLRDDDDTARACLTTDEKARYETWKRRYVDDIVERAHERMGELCFVLGTERIATARDDIAALVSAGKLAKAVAAVDELEQTMAGDPILFDCAPLAEHRLAIVEDLAPSVRNAAALPVVASDALAAYRRVDAAWARAEQALATSGKQIAALPAELATGEARVTLAGEARTCVDKAVSLRELGARDDMPVDDGAELTLATLYTICSDRVSALDELFGRADAHAEVYEAVQRERWEYLNIKGWGMQTVYDSLGKPDAIETRRAALVWTYAASCQSYRFTGNGQLVETTSSCAAR